MRVRRVPAMLGCCAVLIAAAVSGQGIFFKKRNLFQSIDVPLNPMLFGINHWSVGESSRYKVTLFRPDFLEVFHLTLSVLGEEIRDSQSFFWVETDVQPMNSPQERIISKILRPFGNLTRFTEGAIGDILTQVGDNEPLTLPCSMLSAQISQGSRHEQDWSKSDLGQEEVKVGAGSFKTRKLRFVDAEQNSADVWSTPNLGPVGIIKASGNRWRLELISHISRGSVSAIYGSPRSIIPPER